MLIKTINLCAILLWCIFNFSCQSVETTNNTNENLPPIDSVFQSGMNYFNANYERFEYRVPMRDGAELFTLVYVPKDRSENYPILLLRTPYSVELSGGNYAYRQYKFGLSPAFYKEKFIFVYQDVRGRFMSDGDFVNMRPQRTQYNNSSAIDESTDTFDTIDWLIKHIENNNGKVGIYGISYPGFYAAAGAIHAHPALKAVSPQAPIADWYWDDFHHNGAFMLNAAFGFFGVFGVPREELTQNWPQSLARFHGNDFYTYFLDSLIPLKNINAHYYKEKIPFWNEFIAHPNYDTYWQKRNILPHLKNIRPAVLTVGGWFDAEDLYGPLKIYEQIEKSSPKENENYLVMGPWFHGGWARTWGTQLGDVYFGKNPAASKYYQEHIELSFFTHYLKGEKHHNLAEATVFETGTNQWRKFDNWPPKKCEKRTLYFHKNGKLSFKEPTEVASATLYVSDPKNPVPFTGYVTNDIPKQFMVDDQRFVTRREDVIEFQTDVLENDITIAGSMLAKLKVAISATDADFVMKVIDVYPEDIAKEEPFYEGKNMEGYQQLVRAEVMRGRFRNSFEHPEPFVSNEITDVNFELLDILHTFKKGHRIMVQVQSSWFPLVDINPQKYVENIYFAEEDDFIKSTHTIHHSGKFPSRIEIRVLNDD